MKFIREFQQLSKGDVRIAGGKGASLGEMTQAGIPVPPGFVILADAFEKFLQETDLAQEVVAQLNKVNYEDIASVENVSKTLRDLIHDARFPKDLQTEILTNFRKLRASYVAVRSSATAEDSKTASWAGELESFLNTSQKTLLGNIKKCWASLFTPRAIVYRNEKGLRETRVSVAVVVQKMIQAEVAGVAFSVHPVTKDPQQMLIEACWGLGELIVGGVVTPDAYVIDKKDGTLLDTNIASQEKILIRGARGNTLKAVPARQRQKQKLDGKEIRRLADICMQIEKHYGFPCDIEWAKEKNNLFIVQSRPITTL